MDVRIEGSEVRITMSLLAAEDIVVDLQHVASGEGLEPGSEVFYDALVEAGVAV